MSPRQPEKVFPGVSIDSILRCNQSSGVEPKRSSSCAPDSVSAATHSVRVVVGFTHGVGVQPSPQYALTKNIREAAIWPTKSPMLHAFSPSPAGGRQVSAAAGRLPMSRSARLFTPSKYRRNEAISVIMSLGSARQYEAGDAERRAVERERVEAAEAQIPQEESRTHVRHNAGYRRRTGGNQSGGSIGTKLERLEHACGEDDRCRQQKREPRRLLVAQTCN